MTAAGNDEDFSDDSLEVCDKPKKRTKKKTQHRKPVTYFQLYQQKLACEILKTTPTASNSNLSDKSLKKTEEKSSGLESIDRENNIKERKSRKSSKPPQNLWSEYLSTKYKQQHSKSEVYEKNDALRKRLEYGKRMSSINKINQMCLKLKEKNDPKKHAKELKEENSGKEKLTRSCSTVSKSAVKQRENESMESVENIQKKLDQLKIRHQKDKKLVENIRCTLKNVVSADEHFDK